MKTSNRLGLILALVGAFALPILLLTWRDWKDVLFTGKKTIDSPVALRTTQGAATLPPLLDWTVAITPSPTRTITPTSTLGPPTATRTLMPLFMPKRRERPTTTSTYPPPPTHTAVPPTVEPPTQAQTEPPATDPPATQPPEATQPPTDPSTDPPPATLAPALP